MGNKTDRLMNTQRRRVMSQNMTQNYHYIHVILISLVTLLQPPSTFTITKAEKKACRLQNSQER